MRESSQRVVLHPILSIVQSSLGDVLEGIRMPPLPLWSPSKLNSMGAPKDILSGQAYLANSLSIAVWAQCMIGLDFMEGLRSTIASHSHFSAHVQARAAIESFALGFWICDDRLTLDERHLRALLVNRSSVEREQKRYLRGCRMGKSVAATERIRAFDARLQLIENGISAFTERLHEDGGAVPQRVPTISKLVENILADVSPIPEQLYGSLSAVAHADSIFAWGLLSPHPDRIRHPESDEHFVLSPTITDHLTPAVHALMAMCIGVGVGRLTIALNCDMEAMADLVKDLKGFIVHNGTDPTWFRAGDSVSEARLHSLDWYLEQRR